MDLSGYIAVESCSVSFTGRRKPEALGEMARLLSRSLSASGVSEETIFQGLATRESMGSTGFGDGIAIPHCKVEGMTGFALALAVCRKGVEFQSMDGHSVHLICAIAGPPDNPEEHLRLLAVASRVLGSGKSRYELLSSSTPYAIREAFLYHAAPAGVLARAASGFNRLVMIVVQEEKTYHEIMELFLEMGLPGAVTHDGSLMGQVLSGAPVFAGFLDVLGRSKPEPRTIFTLVPAETLDEVVSSIEEITGNLDNHRGACIIVLTPELVRGSLETL